MLSHVVCPKSIQVNFAKDNIGPTYAHTYSSEITFPSGSSFSDYDHFASIMNSIVDPLASSFCIIIAAQHELMIVSN